MATSAKSVDCPACYARAGQPCRTPTGLYSARRFCTARKPAKPHGVDCPCVGCSDANLALDLERVARELARLRDRAPGRDAARVEGLRAAVQRLAHEVSPDTVRP